jgi:DNA-binding beta-propeller fold protein YncE
MYRKYLSGICVVGIAALLAGCGSSSSSTTNNVTGLTKRVLVSNIGPLGGDVLIMDGQHDTLSTNTIAVTQPSKMLTASGTTLILNSTLSNITVFVNSTELVTFNTQMQGQPFDIALSPDGLTAYAAIKNVGVVEVVNTTTGSIVGTMTVPSVARLVEGPKGHKLLAFSANPAGGNTFYIIDTGTNTVTTVSDPSLDQPFTAVFDPSDTNDTTAFILNCGAECGGTAASVVRVTFGGAAPVLSAPIPVAGATVGLLNSSSLYVAGTPPGSPTGTLQVVNTGSLTAGSVINITNGLHTVMAMTTNSRIYIGATQCTPGPVTPQATVTGCLSIFNTSTQAVTIPAESSLRTNFDVTGFQQISNRNVMYVAQGGVLDFFDINADAVSTSIPLVNISGKVVGVLQIDP